jgi:hypothetical protein
MEYMINIHYYYYYYPYKKYILFYLEEINFIFLKISTFLLKNNINKLVSNWPRYTGGGNNWPAAQKKKNKKLGHQRNWMPRRGIIISYRGTLN